MAKGYCPKEFYSNPHWGDNKSIEEVYSAIQDSSCEFFIDNPIELRRNTDFFVLLPPLNYKGTFLKGIFFSQGVDYIYSMFPRINELFMSMAYSMWASIPYSQKADCYLTCYKNPQRENWFKKVYPEKANKPLIPLQDADFISDIVIYPIRGVEKDIDVICVSSLTYRKNLPMLLKSLISYHKRYGKRLKAVLIAGVRGKNKFNIVGGEKIIPPKQ